MPEKKTTKFSADSEDAGLGFEPTTPQADKRDIKRVFQNKVAHLLVEKDWPMKMSVNILTIFYLGAEPSFSAELIRELSNNKEQLVSKGPVLQGREQSPTVGNWLKYFLTKVQEGGKISLVDRAQFFTADKEVNKLPAEEKEVIENLAKLYEAIHDFAENVNKKSLDQIYVFPFSDEEKEEAGKFLEEHAGENVRTENVGTVERPFADEDIWDLYAGKPEQGAKIEKEYDLIAEKTPEQILEYFESALASADKTKVLAGLEVLAEKNIMPKDNPKDLVVFLRSALEEKLKMPEAEAARVGAHLADIFRENGQMEFAQLAYFDEQERVFKWI